MEDYPMDEGDDTDEFEDIENEDENDPDELYERTLEVSLFFKESASFYCVSNFFLLYTQPALRINVACLFALLLYRSIFVTNLALKIYQTCMQTIRLHLQIN